MVRALKLLAFASVGFLPATVIAQEFLPVQTVQDAFHACETVVSADFDGGIEEAFNTGTVWV
ncbi:hypothetical protein [Nioella sp.]|uniref:hypothetical protein n=1 Tax=Nioella sp. TaxID=1912091 RepID=UPI003A850E29